MPTNLICDHSADMLSLICSARSMTVQTLAKLCQTSSQCSKYLLSADGAIHWYNAAKRVCGPDYWRDATLPGQPHASDLRYNAMLRLCPWVSAPRRIDVEKQCDAVKRISGDEECQIHHLVLRKRSKNAADPFVDVYMSATENYEDERLVKVTMNPRPFGPKPTTFTASSMFCTEETIRYPKMTDREREYAAMAHRFLSQYPCFLQSRPVTHATMVHDGLVAVHVFYEIFFFATAPEFRFLRILSTPYEIQSHTAITFGVGEFWAIGCSPRMHEGFELFYYGPRRNKHTHATPLSIRTTPAFWAAEAGDVRAAVAIFKRHGRKLTKPCHPNVTTMLHYATQANQLHAVRELITRYRLPVDLHDNSSHTPINIAAKHGLQEMMNLLVELGAQGNYKISGKGRWPKEEHAVFFIDGIIAEW